MVKVGSLHHQYKSLTRLAVELAQVMHKPNFEITEAGRVFLLGL